MLESAASALSSESATPPAPLDPAPLDPALLDPATLDPAALAPIPAAPATPGGLLGPLLRDGEGLSRRILVGADPGALVAPLAALAAGGAALFGLAVGLQGGLLQAGLSAVKLPVVVVASAGLSLPLLHAACALAGRPLAPARLAGLVLQALATGTVVMAGLAPLAVIAWLTFSLGGHGLDGDWYAYRRFVLAVVAVGATGGLAGALRLLRHLPKLAVLPWSGVLGLTGLQLTWLLRPVIGMPGELVLLRAPEGTALLEVVEALAATLGY